MKKFGLISLCLALMGLAACGEDAATSETLSLNLSNLPNLGSDYVYEGWIIVDDEPVTTGRFSIDDDGNLSPATSEVDSALSANASMFVLTIEPAVGDDPAPADTHVLAGPIDADGNATLTADHPAAMGTDFSDATGGFILATPTTMADMDDNANGIWFLDPMAGPGATLDLPELPAGWVYEGWVASADGPVSTGTFTAVDAGDSDSAGPTAGPDGAPPFPGQDFIDPAVDLTVGFTAVISVEPSPDNDPAPFVLKPLVGEISGDLAPTVQSMNNNAADTIAAGSLSFN